MKWYIPDYGVVPADNAVWLNLEKLEVWREQLWMVIQPRQMNVGEVAYAVFHKVGVSRIEIQRVE